MQPTQPPPLPIQVKGHNGTVRFDGQTVTILRKGFIARSTVGAGEKHIPLGQISAVQWKPFSLMGWGFIQFTIPGGNEVRSRFGSQSRDAGRDENTVQFGGSAENEFAMLRDAINYAVNLRDQQRYAPPPAWMPPPAPQRSVADELAKLHQLVQAGALSPAEYEQAKARLLGGGQ